MLLTSRSFIMFAHPHSRELAKQIHLSIQRLPASLPSRRSNLFSRRSRMPKLMAASSCARVTRSMGSPISNTFCLIQRMCSAMWSMMRGASCLRGGRWNRCVVYLSSFFFFENYRIGGRSSPIPISPVSFYRVFAIPSRTLALKRLSLS